MQTKARMRVWDTRCNMKKQQRIMVSNESYCNSWEPFFRRWKLVSEQAQRPSLFDPIRILHNPKKKRGWRNWGFSNFTYVIIVAVYFESLIVHRNARNQGRRSPSGWSGRGGWGRSWWQINVTRGNWARLMSNDIRWHKYVRTYVGIDRDVDPD